MPFVRPVEFATVITGMLNASQSLTIASALYAQLGQISSLLNATIPTVEPSTVPSFVITCFPYSAFNSTDNVESRTELTISSTEAPSTAETEGAEYSKSTIGAL